MFLELHTGCVVFAMDQFHVEQLRGPRRRLVYRGKMYASEVKPAAVSNRPRRKLTLNRWPLFPPCTSETCAPNTSPITCNVRHNAKIRTPRRRRVPLQISDRI